MKQKHRKETKMDYKQAVNNVLHWNYRGFTEFPLHRLEGDETEITDIYLKENLISRIPNDIGRLNNLESLYLSGNDITKLPREISKLIRLKCLDLSGNRLQYIPDEIGDMRSLKFLILDENELRELPLRMSELRALRYLSVCDNHLQWLPQRPVYNYHHCEFRFWRNQYLSAIPYSLWYHMFRGQQTRSLNIGCFGTSSNDPNKDKILLRLKQNNKELFNKEIKFSRKYEHILNINASICSLMELCKRKFYQMLDSASKRLTVSPTISIYSDVSYDDTEENNNNINDLQGYFEKFHLKNGLCTKKNINEEYYEKCKGDTKVDKLFIKAKMKGYCVPSDIVEEHFYYLPNFLKDELCNGPISKCENVNCKRPVFDYVYSEFCLEKIVLIENTEDVILNAVLCSKSCADTWKIGKTILTWEFVS
ncbi:leucine-rich repeat-containing protein 28-like isoform X1 [Bicyclus anynana]|uniref:Leucine-rich repeat-containing protein 28-like isoform X1 n=1 Tax=Bicyclus anynana TaxID=110368 RepID=A0ABM3LQQ1_BICAN|nr:leucine-rich repeat-containing protein 28-like isoform X1 [Bicyclus anynana]